MGAWYTKLSGPRRVPDASVAERARGLASAAAGSLAKIGALARFVQKDIRYVSVQIGVGGFQPHFARADGFEAEVVRVSNRDDKLFRINLLSFYDQMDAEAALVKLGDRTMAFDPATPFCPFGLVHWSRSNAAALRYSDKPPAFFTTTVYQPDLGLTQREIALKLDLQGGLAGTVKTTCTGHAALVRRLDHIRDDEEAWKKDLEQELADVLPLGATVTLTKVENLDNSGPALIIHCDVSIPGAATVAGDKVTPPRLSAYRRRAVPAPPRRAPVPRVFPLSFPGVRRHPDRSARG